MACDVAMSGLFELDCILCAVTPTAHKRIAATSLIEAIIRAFKANGAGTVVTISSYVAAHFPPCRGLGGFRSEAAVRRERHDGAEANQRPATFSRWQMDDVHGTVRRRGGEQEAHANLDCGRSRWLRRCAAPDHLRWPSQ